MKKIISTLIAAATILLVFLSVQGDTEELSASADSNVVISASAADQPFFNPAADSPDSATLDILLSWVATRENKAALKKQYTDKGFYEFPAVINAMLDIPDDDISNTASANSGSGDTGGETKIMVTLTKPLERDRIQYLTSDMYLVCGKAADSEINIIMAAYNSEKGAYEKINFAGDNGSVRLFYNLFAEELLLYGSRNRYKVIAYTSEAIDEPVAGKNMQVLYFDIYLINKNLLNRERNTSDYFVIPSSDSVNLLWDIREVFPRE